MGSMQGRYGFELEIRKPEEQLDLARAALYIAQEERPDLDPEAYLRRLDRMAAEIYERLPAERYPLRIVRTINSYLFDCLKFRGNTEDYYDPRNSFLDEVLTRRCGIPIALSLVYIEVARRLQFPMVGIGLPGHFLIRPNLE
ncbi:MAG: transglutaminase-like domain-containing protein, partial [Cyanobacteria bacterium J06641_5]